VTPTMSRWCSTALPLVLCSARRRRADVVGRPSPRQRQKAPQSSAVKPLRSSPKGAEPRAAGVSPASMASEVDRIAAPWGTWRPWTSSLPMKWSPPPLSCCLFAGAAAFEAIFTRCRHFCVCTRTAAVCPKLTRHPVFGAKDALQQRWHVHISIELRPM
jgi:hypothetical protein